LVVISQTLHYGASQLRDREGDLVAIDGLSIDATGSALGASYTSKTKGAPYLSFAIGLPVARVHINSDEPAASLNAYGFSDLFVQPIKVGWRQRRFDLVTAYVMYVPTGPLRAAGRRRTRPRLLDASGLARGRVVRRLHEERIGSRRSPATNGTRASEASTSARRYASDPGRRLARV
jgi:hypothetical protein